MASDKPSSLDKDQQDALTFVFELLDSALEEAEADDLPQVCMDRKALEQALFELQICFLLRRRKTG